jgi:hypothetical protein
MATSGKDRNEGYGTINPDAAVEAGAPGSQTTTQMLDRAQRTLRVATGVSLHRRQAFAKLTVPHEILICISTFSAIGHGTPALTFQHGRNGQEKPSYTSSSTPRDFWS